MYTRHSSRFILSILVLALTFSILRPFMTQKAHAQAASFSIITPYYGVKGINSYFDHNTPNFATNNVFVRYDGQSWTGDVDLGHCQNAVNCYDGHNGLDFAMQYEQVLAVADGIVWEAGWTSSCHNGSGCGYGLDVKIKHTVNGQVYSTRYAHLTTAAVHFGQVVKAGQIIGTSGSTGASSGPHLHFEVSICINSFCDDDILDFKAIDPFGWQPAPGAPVQQDPWALAQNPNGANSWCMWKDGEFADLCNPGSIGSPLRAPIYGSEIIIDNTINNTAGFSKGYNGSGNNTCTGIDPSCREWWETSGSSTGWGNHAYRTITNGLAGNYNSPDNWAKWKPPSLASGNYEIFVWVPENLGFSNDTFTWQAHYAVIDSTGSTFHKKVDEFIGAGQAYNPRNKWLSLGIHSLNTNSAIYLYDDGEDHNHCPNGAPANGYNWCRVAADVVKFVQIRYLGYLPVAMNAPTLTPTPTPTNTPTPTPTRTPTPAPPYYHCESNNTFASACYIGAGNTYSYIYPSGDVDWFWFNVSIPASQARLLKVRLLSIPPGVNYDLELYSATGALLGSSHNTGSTDEYIGRHIEESGTYYLRVYPVSGYHQTDSYQITFDYSTVEPMSYPPPEG